MSVMIPAELGNYVSESILAPIALTTAKFNMYMSHDQWSCSVILNACIIGMIY